MSTSTRYASFAFWAAVCGAWLLVGTLGLDHRLAPWIGRANRLSAFRAGYVVAGSLALWLFIRGDYHRAAFSMMARGALAGYLGNLAGYIALTLVMAHSAKRFAFPWDAATWLRGIEEVGWIFTLQFICPAWLWTALGAGLGGASARLVEKKAAA